MLVYFPPAGTSYFHTSTTYIEYMCIYCIYHPGIITSGINYPVRLRLNLNSIYPYIPWSLLPPLYTYICMELVTHCKHSTC